MAMKSIALVECPKAPNGVTFPTFWYTIRNIEDFRICPSCYNEKIASSRFYSYFECKWCTPAPGQRLTCSFNTGRAHQLFDYALQSGDFSPFVDFAIRRPAIATCPGSAGVSGDKGIRWYGTTDIPDFMACEACYEDVISVRAFSENFTPYSTQQGLEEVWACDLALPFVQRCLEQYSPAKDWSSFVNAAKYRLSLDCCTGEQISVKTKNWYIPTRLPQMMICETCFLDKILLLPNGVAEHFSDYDPRQDSPSQTYRCAFGNLSVQTATTRFLEKHFEQWQQLMYRITMLPTCGGEVHNEDLYVLINPVTNEQTDFGMCESCYIGSVECTGFAYLFRRTRLAGSACCEFSSLNDRRGRSVLRLDQAISTNDATELIDYASRSAKIHTCARDGPSNVNCYWWGTEDFVFCAECYDVLGKESYFAPSFQYQGAFDARPEARCDMWSDQIRQAYHDACQKQNLHDFIPIIRTWRYEQQQLRAFNVTEDHRQKAAEVLPNIASSIDVQTEPGVQALQAPAKVSKTAKLTKFLSGMNDVLSEINAGLEAQAQQAQPENVQYHYVAYSPQQELDAASNVQTQPGPNSILGLLASSVNTTNAQRQAQPDALATVQANQPQVLMNQAATIVQPQQYQAYTEPTTSGSKLSHAEAWKLSQQLAARHQFNMGVLQSTAGMYGKHNAAMAGITTYGSAYDRNYDTTYQSHLNGYNYGQQNMLMGMANMMR